MSASDVKVLVGYDGSDDGMAALTFAATEAVAREGMLRIVYAVDDLSSTAPGHRLRCGRRPCGASSCSRRPGRSPTGWASHWRTS